MTTAHLRLSQEQSPDWTGVAWLGSKANFAATFLVVAFFMAAVVQSANAQEEDERAEDAVGVAADSNE